VSSQVVSIVDDDQGARFATASLVRSLGWQARVFASAEEFLDSGLLDETSFLISDIQMPGLSEIEAKGAAAFLEKPVDATTVERLLNLALGTP
jgi:FixJ family two-component response regulator